MYKKIFMGIAAVAALTLVSCSSDDLNSLSDNSSKNEAISFDGYLGRSAVAVNGSRGSEVKIGDLQNSAKGFGVFGYHNTTDHSSETGQPFNANLFNNQQVTYKNSKWTYSPLKFWPSDGHIDFLAYAPYVENKELKENSKLDFTVSSTIANQKDLLWANAADKTKENISSTENKVKFQFAHALSRLGYTVKLNDDYTGTTITLKKITLAGSTDGTKEAFYKNGTIDLSYTSSTTSPTASLWTISASEEKLKFDWFSSSQVLSTTVTKNSDTEYLFVIPQDFSQTTPGADELYVIVEYTIQTGSTATMTSKVCKKLDRKFLQGKAYTINLTIGLTPIEFDADVTEWKTPTDGAIDINSWE